MSAARSRKVGVSCLTNMLSNTLDNSGLVLHSRNIFPAYLAYCAQNEGVLKVLRHALFVTCWSLSCVYGVLVARDNDIQKTIDTCTLCKCNNFW